MIPTKEESTPVVIQVIASHVGRIGYPDEKLLNVEFSLSNDNFFS